VDNATNNLANIDTAGFKKDSQAFIVCLRKEIYRVEAVNERIKKTYIGPLEQGVALNEVTPNMRQGDLEFTGNKLDFAVEGNAFFTVEGIDGQNLYTRNGEWKINNEGILIDNIGRYILNDAGERINFTDAAGIDYNGNIVENNIITGRIGTVSFQDSEKLLKIGNNYFIPTEASGEPAQDFESRIFQGYIEKSNVDALREMVNLIEAQRHFDIAQRVITTEDALLDAAINKAGPLR